MAEVFDWRAKAAEPGFMLIDVEGSPVVGSFESKEFFSALSGNPVGFSKVVVNGAPATEEEFLELIAERESLRRKA